MDPRHRRIAFVSIVSGEFECGMSVNLTRIKKLSNPQMSPSLLLKYRKCRKCGGWRYY